MGDDSDTAPEHAGLVAGGLVLLDNLRRDAPAARELDAVGAGPLADGLSVDLSGAAVRRPRWVSTGPASADSLAGVDIRGDRRSELVDVGLAQIDGVLGSQPTKSDGLAVVAKLGAVEIVEEDGLDSLSHFVPFQLVLSGFAAEPNRAPLTQGGGAPRADQRLTKSLGNAVVHADGGLVRPRPAGGSL